MESKNEREYLYNSRCCSEEKLMEEAHKRNLSLKEYLRLLVINS